MFENIDIHTYTHIRTTNAYLAYKLTTQLQGRVSVVVYSVLLVSVRPFFFFCFFFYFLFISFRRAWWPPAGKEQSSLSSWLSACAAVLYTVLIVCVSFPFGF